MCLSLGDRILPRADGNQDRSAPRSGYETTIRLRALDFLRSVALLGGGVAKLRRSALLTGAFLRSFGSYGSGNGQFLSGISGTAIDPNGDAWVSDAGNYRVQEFANNGAFLEKIGTEGHGNDQFQSPGAIVIH